MVPAVDEVAKPAADLGETSTHAEDAKKMVVHLLVVRNAAEVSFNAAFITFGTSVQSLAGGSAALIREAALPLASHNTTPVVLTKIARMSVTQGDEKGHVDVAWHGSHRAKSYVVRYGLGGPVWQPRWGLGVLPCLSAEAPRAQGMPAGGHVY